MRVLPSSIVERLETGRYATRFMLRMDLPGGSDGVWTDTYTVEHEGVIYTPVGSALVFSAVPGAVGLNADQLEVTATGLSAELNALLQEHAWHQRPATLFRAFLDDTGVVVHVEPVFAGYMDHASIADVADGAARVTLRIESNARELNRSIGRSRSDSDQRSVDSGDEFFAYVGVVASKQEIYWGRKGPQSPFK